jgi:peptide deformylase
VAANRIGVPKKTFIVRMSGGTKEISFIPVIGNGGAARITMFINPPCRVRII